MAIKLDLQIDGNVDKHGILYYKGLPDDLESLDTYEPFRCLTTPPLSPNQSADCLKAVAFKRFDAFYDTGLGKTYLAGGFMRAIKNAIPNAKFLMIIKNRQFSQTPRDITKITGLKCKVFTGEQTSMPTINTLDLVDVMMITPEFLNSVNHMLMLNRLIGRITGIIADEIHLLCNLDEASSAFMLYCMSQRVEYFLGLTATPVTTDLKQFAKILSITNPEAFPNYRKIGNELKKFGMGAIPDEMQDCFVIRKRPKRRRGIAYLVEPSIQQIGAKGIDLFVKTKGPGAYNQLHTLVHCIKEYRPGHGVVYVNHHEVYKFLEEELPKCGIRFAIINGDTSHVEQDQYIENYLNGQYDVILTNSKEALNMSGDYVIFYEFTSSVQQVIGRVERGLETKSLDINYIFTLGTDEPDYFERNVRNISQEIEDLFDIDLREVTSIHLSPSEKRRKIIFESKDDKGGYLL